MMKTIKIIDLLNKIANGEDVPNKIIFHGNYYYNVGNKEQAFYENYELDDSLLLYAIYNEKYLNDEVEIIEEENLEEILEEKKIPEKLGVINYTEDQATALIHLKVDEIIDYLQSKGE